MGETPGLSAVDASLSEHTTRMMQHSLWLTALSLATSALVVALVVTRACAPSLAPAAPDGHGLLLSARHSSSCLALLAVLVLGWLSALTRLTTLALTVVRSCCRDAPICRARARLMWLRP